MLKTKKYQKLLKAQKLLKLVAKKELESEQFYKQELMQRKDALFGLLNNPERTIEEFWISKEFSYIHKEQHTNEAHLELKTIDFRQANKRLEITESKYEKARKAEEERQSMLELLDSLK